MRTYPFTEQKGVFDLSYQSDLLWATYISALLSAQSLEFLFLKIAYNS